MPFFVDNYRPPSVSILLDGLEVTAGETVLVPYSYIGEPSAVVRWLKDGQEMPNVWTSGGAQTAVELKDVSESFVLTCLVDNGLDTPSVHVFVNVTSGKNNNPGLFTAVYKLVMRLL